MELVASMLVLLVFVAFGVFIWRQTKAKGRWGIDLTRKTCPRCGTPLPLIRKPASTQEMLWGGWTCPKCGAKIDKYGRERATPQAPS